MLLSDYAPLFALIDNGMEKGFIGSDCEKLITLAATPAGAMEHITDYVRESTGTVLFDSFVSKQPI